jgi:hypothetical protein
VGVGFVDGQYNLAAMPGWLPESVGYHGDDGKKFLGNGTGQSYGPTWSEVSLAVARVKVSRLLRSAPPTAVCSTIPQGDTVGAALYAGRCEAFFTLNGKHLGIAALLPVDNMWPAVGARSPGAVLDVNLGQRPFVFDIQVRRRTAAGLLPPGSSAPQPVPA